MNNRHSSLRLRWKNRLNGTHGAQLNPVDRLGFSGQQHDDIGVVPELVRDFSGDDKYLFEFLETHPYLLLERGVVPRDAFQPNALLNVMIPDSIVMYVSSVSRWMLRFGGVAAGWSVKKFCGVEYWCTPSSLHPFQSHTFQYQIPSLCIRQGRHLEGQHILAWIEEIEEPAGTSLARHFPEVEDFVAECSGSNTSTSTSTIPRPRWFTPDSSQPSKTVPPASGSSSGNPAAPIDTTEDEEEDTKTTSSSDPRLVKTESRINPLIKRQLEEEAVMAPTEADTVGTPSPSEHWRTGKPRPRHHHRHRMPRLPATTQANRRPMVHEQHRSSQTSSTSTSATFPKKAEGGESPPSDSGEGGEQKKIIRPLAPQQAIIYSKCLLQVKMILTTIE